MIRTQTQSIVAARINTIMRHRQSLVEWWSMLGDDERMRWAAEFYPGRLHTTLTWQEVEYIYEKAFEQ